MGRFRGHRQVLEAGGIALDPSEGIWGPQALDLEIAPVPTRRQRRWDRAGSAEGTPIDYGNYGHLAVDAAIAEELQMNQANYSARNY